MPANLPSLPSIVWHAALGLALGFGLSRIGFSDFGEVHRMFILRDPRLYLTFAGGVVALGVGLVILDRRGPDGQRPIHRGVVLGSLMFGAGWAICGSCPSIALVQLGEGQLAAGWTLGGILLGTWLYGPLQRRLFRWDSGSCE